MVRGREDSSCTCPGQTTHKNPCTRYTLTVSRALSLVSCLHSAVLGSIPISKIRKQRPTEVTCDLAEVAQPVLDNSSPLPQGHLLRDPTTFLFPGALYCHLSSHPIHSLLCFQPSRDLGDRLNPPKGPSHLYWPIAAV